MANSFLKNLFLSLFVLSFFGAFFLTPVSAYDFNKESGLDEFASETGHLKLANSGKSITTRISEMIMPLLGVIYLFLMMYAGYLWMAASGNEDQVAKAKKIIVAATIGLLITFMSYAISIFVVSAFRGGFIK